MTVADRIPVERGTTLEGREIRCARWLSMLVSRTHGRTRFVMTARLSADDRDLRLLSFRGVELLRVPRAVFRSWARRAWICGQEATHHGGAWEVTDAGLIAARSVAQDGTDER